MKRRWNFPSLFIILFFLLLLSPAPVLQADERPFPLIFSPSTADLGSLEHGTLTPFQVEIISRSEQEIRLRMIPTCSCLLIDTQELRLEPGERRVLILRFDTTGMDGSFEKYFMIRLVAPSAAKALFAVTGSVRK